MAGNETPVGQRYDLLYVDRGQPSQDSRAFRNRLSAYISQRLDDISGHIALALERELGAKVPRGSHGFAIGRFLESADILHVLNAIRIVMGVAYLSDRPVGGTRAKAWHEFVERALREENVGYRLDPAGGVHPMVDQQFEFERGAVIGALQPSRYSAVLAEFEKAHLALEQDPPDGKAAIRQTFEAAETLFKLVCNSTKVQRLGAGEIREHLGPIVTRLYPAPPAIASAAGKMLSAASGWVDAAHPFRHGQNVETPLVVPVELAVTMMGTGASLIRWLAQIDARVNK